MRRFCCVDTTAFRWMGCTLVMAAVLGSSTRAQDAAPKVHDKAEARQFLGKAEQVAAGITDKRKQVQALEEIADAKAMAGDYEAARVIARTLGTNKSKAAILSSIATAQFIGGDQDEGLKTLQGIAEPGDKCGAYWSIAMRLLDKGRKPLALVVIGKALAPLSKLTDLDSTTYGLLIGYGFARAGNPQETSSLAASLKPSPIQAPVRSALEAIAKAWAKDLPGAEMKLAEVKIGFLREMVLLSLAEVQYEAGDLVGGLARSKELLSGESTGSLSSVLGVILGIQSRNGGSADKKTLLQFALSSAVDKANGQGISAVAIQQADQGEIEAAVQTLERIPKADSQIDARQAIADAKAKAGDVPGAIAMAPADADPFLQTEVLIGVARGILNSLEKPAKP